jgi:membrane fusion protein (multidrug efflux system)
VRARLANPDGNLRPGMFAEVTASRGRIEDALTIPEAALVPEGGQVFVYRFDGGKAAKVAVTTGLRVNGMVQVVSGLTPSDTVVTAGQMKIHPGMAIVAMNIGMAAPATAAAPAAPPGEAPAAVGPAAAVSPAAQR